jgi:hypothetical protein
LGVVIKGSRAFRGLITGACGRTTRCTALMSDFRVTILNVAPVANTFGCAGGHPFNATNAPGIILNCSGIRAAPPDGGTDGNTVNAVIRSDRKHRQRLLITMVTRASFNNHYLNSEPP